MTFGADIVGPQWIRWINASWLVNYNSVCNYVPAELITFSVLLALKNVITYILVSLGHFSAQGCILYDIIISCCSSKVSSQHQRPVSAPALSSVAP